MDKGFAHFEAWRDEVFEQEEIDQQKLAQKIKREEHWMTYGVTARRKRNMRRVRELAELRKQKREHRGPQGTAKLSATEAEVSGKLVIEAKGISKTYGDRTIVQGVLQPYPARRPDRLSSARTGPARQHF